MSRRFSDKELDKLLTMYAKDESNNLGTEEELFNDLKIYLEKEKQKKREKRKIFFSSGKFKIAMGAVTAVLILVIGLTLYFTLKPKPNYGAGDNLIFYGTLNPLEVSDEELNLKISNAINPDIAGFALENCTIYVNENDECQVYTILYKNIAFETITIIVILNDIYGSGLEMYLNEASFKIINDIQVSERHLEDQNRHIYKFYYNDQLVYLDIQSSDSVLAQNILENIIN